MTGIQVGKYFLINTIIIIMVYPEQNQIDTHALYTRLFSRSNLFFFRKKSSQFTFRKLFFFSEDFVIIATIITIIIIILDALMGRIIFCK